MIFLIFLSASSAAALNLEGFGGWEGDSHASGFAFYALSGTYSLRDPIALVGKIEGNYLYYQYGSSDDLTRFTSPGMRLMSGIKIQSGRILGFLLGGPSSAGIERSKAPARTFSRRIPIRSGRPWLKG